MIAADSNCVSDVPARGNVWPLNDEIQTPRGEGFPRGFGFALEARTCYRDIVKKLAALRPYFTPQGRGRW